MDRLFICPDLSTKQILRVTNKSLVLGILIVEGDIEMVDFGARLRMLRQAKGMTQKQLADQLRLTKSVISAYETDLRLPSYDILIRLASIFDVTTDYLLGVSHGKLVDVSGLGEEDCRMVVQLISRLRQGTPARGEEFR